MDSILIAKGLSKQYNTLLAVDNVHFELHTGEIFSLLGPNGAGKTTTISMLSTLMKPTKGTATISGFDVVKSPLDARRFIGVIPQDLALYADLTGRENLHFWGSMYNLKGKLLKSRSEEILERIGLSEKADTKVKTYSGGMKRRLNIGVGLLHHPKLLFMDEPTVGIDPQSRRRILDLVKELNQEGMSVLYTTHYMEEAQEISDRVGIIDRGKMIAVGTQAELTAMVGESETLRLHLRDEQQEISMDFLENIMQLEGVLKASRNDGQIVVNVENAEDAIANCISLANEYEVKISSVDIQEPNLETVFLHLTGRALRD
jgi:ABC-2 type transport system ATP-binding protein